MVGKRGEVDSAVLNKLVLKKAVEHKIKLLTEKAIISEKEVYDLIRGFFKKFIKIDYEFTSEELIKEMRKVYLPGDLPHRVGSMLHAVSEMEHLSKEFSRQELIAILQEFKGIVDDMITTHYEDKGLFRKVMDFFHMGVSKKHETVLENPSLFSDDERAVVKMNMLLDDGRRLAEKDLEAAKKCYHELHRIYESLDPERKKMYFKAVNDIYALLKEKEN